MCRHVRRAGLSNLDLVPSTGMLQDLDRLCCARVEVGAIALLFPASGTQGGGPAARGNTKTAADGQTAAGHLKASWGILLPPNPIESPAPYSQMWAPKRSAVQPVLGSQATDPIPDSCLKAFVWVGAFASKPKGLHVVL